MPRLRRSRLDRPGIRRHRCGSGFRYKWDNGDALTDPDTLARIKALVIPPAWTEVWICPWPNGHIQAVGRDAAGRRQYRYHDEWRRRRDAEKFERMIELAAALPALRQAVAQDLDQEGLPRTRVLALAVRLLDIGLFRIGCDVYAEEHETYGLATLERRHVTFKDGRAVFEYQGKAGKQQLHAISDPVAVALLRRLKARRRGDKLLAWKTSRSYVEVRAEDVNEYLKEIAGSNFSAKDFRTWGATVLGAVMLATAPQAKSSSAAKRAVAGAIRSTAEALGNTPAVCRKSYVDPRVVDRFSSGETIAEALTALPSAFDPCDIETVALVEQAVVALLTGEGDDASATAAPALAKRIVSAA